MLPDWALSNALFVAWIFAVWRYHCRGMLIGCTRRAAADFSFIMAVPVFILLWVLSDNSGYISNYLSLSMIANEEKMKFKKFRKNTCIGYRFMLL